MFWTEIISSLVLTWYLFDFQGSWRKWNRPTSRRITPKQSQFEANWVKRKSTQWNSSWCFCSTATFRKIVSNFLFLLKNIFYSFFNIFVSTFCRVISEAKHVGQFPNLNGTTSLELIRFDRSNIKEVTQTICHHCPNLKSL